MRQGRLGLVEWRRCPLPLLGFATNSFFISQSAGSCDILIRMEDKFDIVVVGGGHAGAEAALIAARMGVKTLLVTGLLDAIARMPCNPSIGGLAKSHLVFELDALGGEMGFNADLTSLQEKTLNTSRGPAVQATRAQCDKAEYTRRMQRVIACQPHLTVIEDCVVDVKTQSGPDDDQPQNHVIGVETEHHGFIGAQRVILTTGTSLRGRIFIGKDATPSGGDGRPAVDRLSESLMRLGFTLTRLKTGTPPRLAASSIDFSKTTIQPGEENPYYFSLRTRFSSVRNFIGNNPDSIEQLGSDHMQKQPQNAGPCCPSCIPLSLHSGQVSPKSDRVSTWKHDLFASLHTSSCPKKTPEGTASRTKTNIGINIPSNQPIPRTSYDTYSETRHHCSFCQMENNLRNNKSTAFPKETSPYNCDMNIAQVRQNGDSVSTWKHDQTLADHFAPWPVNSLMMNCFATSKKP